MTFLTKLVPRLATDADGEVLATVRAIRDVLAAEGLDLHDLAAAIGSAEIASTVKPAQVQQAPSWTDLTHQERLAWFRVILANANIGDLERDQLSDLYSNFKVGVSFSPH